MAPSRIVVACIFVLLSTHTLAFVVHKRAAYNPDVERGELKDALRLLERQRRRLDNIDEYGTAVPQETWWPREETDDGIDESDIDEAQYVPPADEYLQSILPPDEDERSYPYSDNSHEYVTHADDKHPGEDYKETPVPADMQELEDMLEPTEEEEDTKSETKREAGMDLAMDADDQGKEKKENNVQQMDPELVKKLLAEADKMEVEKVKEYSKNEPTSTASPDELRNLLDEDENEPAKDRKKKEDTDDAQGEVGAFLAPSDSGDVKKKRSGSNPLAEDPSISNNPNNIALNYIKQLILLEDRENTNLAQALNFATLAQLDSSGKYLTKEIEFLRNAIADEAELQDLLTDVGSQVNPTLDADNDADNVDEPILERKRADPELDRPGLEDLSPSDREKAVILSYLLRKGAPQEYDNDIDPVDKSDFESYNWLNGPVRDDREFKDDDEKPLDRRIYRKRKDPEEAGTQRAVQGVLRSYLERMPSWERSQLKDAVEEQIQDLEADEDEVCPAVVNLVQGCPLQGEEKVELDDEALDLCNRHSLCYSCGAMHGLSADDCDTGYMNEASRKCGPGDNECDDGITALYLMFLQHHRYIPGSATEDMCADSCVLDYITGADGK